MCVCVYTHTQHTQHTHTHTHTHTHMKVHYSSQCVMGTKTDKEINRVEQVVIMSYLGKKGQATSV